MSKSASSDYTVAELLRRMATDETACYVVVFTSPGGKETVMCNERMEELFISTQGKSSSCIPWMRCSSSHHVPTHPPTHISNSIFQQTTTQDLQGLVSEAGVASIHFWGQFLSNPGLDEMYAAVSCMLFDSYTRQPQLDAVLECRTRDG